MHWVLDVVLILALAGYVINGARRGFAHVLGSLIGVIAGGIAAFYLLPVIGGIIPSSFWRLIATLGAAVALVIVGHVAGATIGDAIARRISREGTRRVIDRVFGSIIALVASALVISLLAASVAPLGVPLLSSAIGDSVVINTIQRLTPAPVQRFFAQAQSSAVRDTIPSIVDALGAGSTPPPVPDVATGSAVLQKAALSVVKVSGNAYQCGQSQSGSGFVVARDRVLTNAHVVAGVTEPVVQTQTGEALAGRVVYFDPIGDLAVIAVNGLDLANLSLGARLGSSDSAVWDGYPFGGPFTTGGATVLRVGTERVDDIYGNTTVERDVYTIAADIQQGDSGGPLLATDGEVVGVVFAKSATTSGVGFAMTVTEVAPVVDKAADLTTKVASGHCSRE
jgi:S1-C subfamily serine protease